MIWTLCGNFQDMPIEVFESRLPARTTESGYRMDSAGPSQEAAWQRHHPRVPDDHRHRDEPRFERSGNPVWGLFGGKDGAPSKWS